MARPPKQQGDMGASKIPFAGQEGLFFQLREFGGINTRSDRTDIGDEEFSWLENFIPAADGDLSALYSNAAPIKTVAVKTIVYFKMFNIGATQFAALFYSDGTADQVSMAGATVVISAVAGKFYNGGDLPFVAQWASSGIIIVTTASANGYFAWDGALHSPGDATSPAWLNGGTPTAMPNGIQGTYVETYQSRVWVDNGATGFLSAPANGASFSGATGGGAFPSTDSFLRIKYTALRQSSGFLYLFGDSSINVISNVQTSGSPIATTFNNQNVDAQVGTPWPDSVEAFSKGLTFGNPVGIHVLYGGSTERVSEQLDGIFRTANFAAPVPSSAVATIFGINCYCTLVRMTDLFGNVRNIMCCWTGKKWFLASQDKDLTFIGTQEINSQLFAWGTDGASLFQLFQVPSTTLKKIIQTKLWGGDGYLIIKQALRAYSLGTDRSGNGYSFTGTIDMLTEQGTATAPITLGAPPQQVTWINNLGQPVQFINNAAQPVTFTRQGLSLLGQGAAASAPLLGFTLQSTSSDFDLSALTLLYRRLGPVGG
jgi:hypothetical protein